MIIAYTDEEFRLAKTQEKLNLLCKHCNNIFLRSKKEIMASLNIKRNKSNGFCNQKCFRLSLVTKINVVCPICNREFKKSLSQIKKSKSGLSFCSHKCSAIYSNAHKTVGTRRSKLESWLEKQLISFYPNLEIHYNKKDVINSELDIYIPVLKLAFELNGIFHYEPIYGPEKFESIKNNDSQKFQLCIKKGISLCIIDTSSQKYFKESSSKKYLDIIINIIQTQLSPLPELHG